ncbi:MAG TPA: haloacid dehalogenase-like hydrolase [Opitutaceae bacterium]|nr:haloacid dehalogenase-like hydrolase [Opitutaceae bacterium]
MTSPTPLLLLWDIDGTLQVSGGAGMRALSAALATTFGISHSLADIEFAGRTDRWILQQIVSKFGLPPEPSASERFFRAYFSKLPSELSPESAYLLPGVADLISEVHGKSHLTQGLLTGNMRASAEIKLRFSGVWDYFPFGAFGDEHERRDDLGPLAVARARAHRGISFAPEQIWIIGDTPHDIACGRAMGARTLAVATGRHSMEELGRHAPDAVLPNLADREAFWATLAQPRSTGTSL